VYVNDWDIFLFIFRSIEKKDDIGQCANRGQDLKKYIRLQSFSSLRILD